MLSHYRKRADECASRIGHARTEAIRQDYQRLLNSWKALIQAEEDRLTRIATSHSPARQLRQAGG
jgi:Tfp pilus assembly protein FimT